MYGTRPLAPEEFTASLWEEVNALKEAISMSGRARSWQKTKEFLHGLEQGTASLTDEELVILKRIVERRSHDAAYSTVASIDTVQYCDPRQPNTEILSDTRTCMKENEEGVTDLEQGQFEPPLASAGFETPGQQFHPNWETGQTTAAGYLTAGVCSNLGEDASSPTERVDTRVDSKITTAPTAPNTHANPTTKRHQAKRTSNLTPKGKEESHRLGTRGVPIAFSLSGGDAGHGVPAVCALFLVSCAFCLYLPVYMFYQVIILHRAEKHERKH